MSSQREVDIYGAISACYVSGRTLHVHCAGSELRVDAASVRAVLSAFAALRASGVVALLEPPALDRLNDFRIELCSEVAQAGTEEHRLPATPGKR